MNDEKTVTSPTLSGYLTAKCESIKNPMDKPELIEALKMLARGRLDAAETIAEMLMPEPKTITVEVPKAKKAK